jgi:ubiquinone/menaquinone biosynthesis C-methylase UbiE
LNEPRNLSEMQARSTRLMFTLWQLCQSSAEQNKKTFSNVVPVLSAGYPVNIASQSADVIYALDMFHHVKDTDGFLTELHRVLKPNGALFIESGHQPLAGARKKILNSDCWVIVKEEQNLFECASKEHGIA